MTGCHAKELGSAYRSSCHSFGRLCLHLCTDEELCIVMITVPDFKTSCTEDFRQVDCHAGMHTCLQKKALLGVEGSHGQQIVHEELSCSNCVSDPPVASELIQC